MSGVECFLCLGEQEDMSSLGGHLASHHKISHEADVILFLQQCSQKQRQDIVREMIKPDPAMVGDAEKQETMFQSTPPASPKDEAPTVEELVAISTSSISNKIEPKATKENTEEEFPKKLEPKEDERSSTVAEKPKIPERPVLRTRTREVAVQEIKTRKRKSLNLCTNAVSNRCVAKNMNCYMNSFSFLRIQFWKTREETVDKDSDSHFVPMVSSPKKERKSENLVNKLLKQQTIKKTEEDEILPSPRPEYTTPFEGVSTCSRSPNDTLLMFDELFTAVCPETRSMDHIETNFNQIYEEGENHERKISEESVGEEDIFESSEMDLELSEENPELKKENFNIDHDEEEATASRDVSYVNSIVDSIEKVSKLSESKESISKTSSPNGSTDVDKSTPLCNLENVDGRYKCDDCGKDFKFLTYLKGHKSKSGCINSNGKKKRPSMNFSKIIY